MKAKFTWNGQVIEQELRRMDDVPNNKRNVMALEVTDATHRHTLWWGERSQKWFDWLHGSDELTDFEISNYIGWCEMPELVEVVE